MDQKKLDQQSQHWEASFSSKPEMFGQEPSAAAVKSLNFFKNKNIVELGAGLGREPLEPARGPRHLPPQPAHGPHQHRRGPRRRGRAGGFTHLTVTPKALGVGWVVAVS